MKLVYSFKFSSWLVTYVSPSEIFSHPTPMIHSVLNIGLPSGKSRPDPVKLKCNRNILIYPRFWGTFCRVALPWTFSRHDYPLPWSIVCSASGLAASRRSTTRLCEPVASQDRAGSGHLVDREWPHTSRGEGAHSAGDSTALKELRVSHSVPRVSCPGHSESRTTRAFLILFVSAEHPPSTSYSGSDAEEAVYS